MESTLADAWNIHLRIQLSVLDAISPEALAGVSASKGRSVGEQFAHIHNVRLMWLEASAPDLIDGMMKLGEGAAGSKETLHSTLERSGDAISTLLEWSVATGKIKGFKRNPTAFYSYLIAHESYHMGEIGMTLNQSGHKLDRHVAYGMWEWEKK